MASHWPSRKSTVREPSACRRRTRAASRSVSPPANYVTTTRIGTSRRPMPDLTDARARMRGRQSTALRLVYRLEGRLSHHLDHRPPGPDRGHHSRLAVGNAFGRLNDLLSPLTGDEHHAAAIGDDQVARAHLDAADLDHGVEGLLDD